MSVLLTKRFIHVTQEFVDYAEATWNKRGKGGGRIFGSRSNCDALLFEWWLIKNRHVNPPQNLHHDFIWSGMKIDCKEVNGGNFNIQPNKTQFYIDGVNKGDLTHFLFYESSRIRDILHFAGEVVEITPLYVLPAKTVLKSINKSEQKTAEGFIPKPILEMLAESD